MLVRSELQVVGLHLAGATVSVVLEAIPYSEVNAVWGADRRYSDPGLGAQAKGQFRLEINNPDVFSEFKIGELCTVDISVEARRA